MMIMPMLRKSGLIAAALLLGSAAASEKKVVSKNAKNVENMMAFTRAMEGIDASPEIKQHLRNSKLEHKRALKTQMMKNMLAKATPVEAGTVKVQNDIAPEHPKFMNVPTKTSNRKLADYDDAAVDYSDYGFDIAEYSMKYIGCSAIVTYSSEAAADEELDTVLETKRFVMFRLCPTAYCSDYSKFGCSSNYGEYVMEMDDYLLTMQTYNEALSAGFCSFCEMCMTLDSYNYQNGNNKNAGNDYQYDGNRKLEAEAQGDYYADDNSNSHACGYYDACADYSTTCVAEEATDDANYVAPINYEDFFECVQASEDQDDSTSLYVGPHCASDGFTITIGLYNDEMCSNYIGDKVKINKATGLNFQTDALSSYTTTECISCKESEMPYQQSQGDYDDADDVNEMCTTIYDGAGKCNRYYTDAETASYGSYEQEDNEDVVCGFISNLVRKSYSEKGEIILYGGLTWKNPFTYHNLNSAMSNGQRFSLTMFMIGTACMGLYALYLHHALTADQKDLAYEDKLERQSSGIVMGRSRSEFDGSMT